MFDDSRLESPEALGEIDGVLRRLATGGARLRSQFEGSVQALNQLDLDRPRAVVVAGAESRLVRAILEPVCPVPLVAWPAQGLPGWVGALDMVVVLAPEGDRGDLAATASEAVRRGSRVLLAAPAKSAIADRVGGRGTTLLPTSGDDGFAAAVMVLSALAQSALGPQIDVAAVADAMDTVAEQCSPYESIATNPAKELALGLAEELPLVWGGSVLAARAARRVAEVLRAASGRPVLAAEASELENVMQAAGVRDPFADPFEDAAQDRRPALLILDDGHDDDILQLQRTRLTNIADARDIRVCTVQHLEGPALARYAAMLQTGWYAGAYLALGLGRPLH